MEKQARKNINLYTIYELFGYDIHFYLVIGIFFLTEVKNLNVTEFLLLNTIMAFFMSLALIPSGIIADKVGRKQCIIVGNLSWMIFGIALIFGTDFWQLALASMFLGIGYALKACSETPILIDSLTLLKREKEFGKIEGKAFSIFAYMSCAFALISGYIYTLNNYLPIILMVIFAFGSLVLSTFFTNIKPKEDTEEKKPSEAGLLKETAKHIFLSKRLRALLLFSFAFIGIIVISGDFSKIALQETGMSVTAFGIIQACFWLFIGVGSALQFKIEKYTRNKTFMICSMVYVISFIIIGALGMTHLAVGVGLIILIMFNQYVIEGVYGVSSQKYVTNFTSQEVRGKMLSILYLVEELGATMFLAIATLILDRSSSIYLSYIILGVLFLVIFTIVLTYMKKRVGLKPGEYTKEDKRYENKKEYIHGIQ